MEHLLIISKRIYNCLCCIFISLIIVGATEFIAAVHLLCNVLSFYTFESANSLKFNERIYYSVFSCLSERSEKSLGTVVILPLA